MLHAHCTGANPFPSAPGKPAPDSAGGRAASDPVRVDGLRFSGIEQVVVFSGGDPNTLHSILDNPAFPRGADVVTGEMSLVGWRKGAGLILARSLPEMRRQGTLARKAGDSARAAALEADYRGLAARAREELKAFARSNAAGGGVPADILKLSRQKHLTLWVGGPRYDEKSDKLYNSYFCVSDGRVVSHHDKKFLYSTERDVFDEPREFDRGVRGEVSLICWEAEALNPHFHKPSPLRNVKQEIASSGMRNPLLLRVAAYWPEKQGVGLRGQVSKAVRRGQGTDRGIALRPEGALALVSNDGAEAYVMGPSRKADEPFRKSEIYAEIREPGIIRAQSNADGTLAVARYDRLLHKLD